MNDFTQRTYTRRIIFRLSEHQYQHVKSQINPSDYIRTLVESDWVVNNAKS